MNVTNNVTGVNRKTDKTLILGPALKLDFLQFSLAHLNRCIDFSGKFVQAIMKCAYCTKKNSQNSMPFCRKIAPIKGPDNCIF